MSAARSLTTLPVLMPVVPDQRWSCHSCGNCCRSLTGHLTDADRRRIDQHNWTAELGVAPYVSLGRGFVLNKTADDACVFLDEQNRCRIHSKFGEAAKPVACRIFPFSIRRVTRGWQGSLRFDCPSVAENKGAPIASHRAWLTGLAGEMPTEVPDSDTLDLQPGVKATLDEVEMLMSRLKRWLFTPASSSSNHNLHASNSTTNEVAPLYPPLLRGDKGGSPNHDSHAGIRSLHYRIFGAAHATTLLARAKFDKVRGDRFAELLDIIFDALPDELAVEIEPPTSSHLGMLRQLVLAHTEHATLAEARSGFWGRSSRKLSQLVSARRMRRGNGTVPQLRGFSLPHQPTFADVDRVQPASADSIRIEDLLHRYLTARIEAHSLYGAGYYGWPMFSGLSALWLSIAVTGWLTRYHAAGHGRNEVTFADTTAALGIVDRAVTRLPSLGSLAERLRAAYLLRDDGVCRLLQILSCASAH